MFCYVLHVFLNTKKIIKAQTYFGSIFFNLGNFEPGSGSLPQFPEFPSQPGSWELKSTHLIRFPGLSWVEIPHPHHPLFKIKSEIVHTAQLPYLLRFSKQLSLSLFPHPVFLFLSFIFLLNTKTFIFWEMNCTHVSFFRELTVKRIT